MLAAREPVLLCGVAGKATAERSCLSCPSVVSCAIRRASGGNETASATVSGAESAQKRDQCLREGLSAREAQASLHHRWRKTWPAAMRSSLWAYYLVKMDKNKQSWRKDRGKSEKEEEVKMKAVGLLG